MAYVGVVLGLAVNYCRATKGMMDIMEERQRRGRGRRRKGTVEGVAQEEGEGPAGGQADPATGQSMPQTSLNSLVKAVKAKVKPFKDRKRKLHPKLHPKQHGSS